MKSKEEEFNNVIAELKMNNATLHEKLVQEESLKLVSSPVI